jgi:mevalonate pyrophosphate decarboxylase
LSWMKKKKEIKRWKGLNNNEGKFFDETRRKRKLMRFYLMKNDFHSLQWTFAFESHLMHEIVRSLFPFYLIKNENERKWWSWGHFY